MTTRANTTKSIGKEILTLFLHVPLAMAVGTVIGLVLNVFIGRMLAILGFRTNQLPDLGVFNPLLWIGSLSGSAHQSSHSPSFRILGCWSGLFLSPGCLSIRRLWVGALRVLSGCIRRTLPAL